MDPETAPGGGPGPRGDPATPAPVTGAVTVVVGGIMSFTKFNTFEITAIGIGLQHGNKSVFPH